APNIGHVFMRADNAGQGIEVAANGQYFLKLPQAFVHSEYQTLQSQLSSYTPSSEMQAQLSAVAQAVQAFDATAGDSAQALAAYDALALIMPLKEAVVVDSSTQSILAAGLRDDFDMNYEG